MPCGLMSYREIFERNPFEHARMAGRFTPLALIF
jgi:hypothetical protein